VSRYRRSLVRYCASVVGDGDAEEAVQEALLKAHAALLRGDPVRRLSPWLHVVAHNTALSYLRARSSRPQAADTHYDWYAMPDSSGEHREELGEVLDAVRSLPDRQRDAIVMRELEGRSYDEIATRLGSSPSAVRQLLHRARSSVRERVMALLPLEPLVRWALTGAGGADAAGGATLSGACVVGAKACVALLLPATIAVVVSSPAPPPRTSTVAKSRPVASATHARHAGGLPALARVASDSAVTARRRAGAAVSPSRDAGRLAAGPLRAGVPTRHNATSPLAAAHAAAPPRSSRRQRPWPQRAVGRDHDLPAALRGASRDYSGSMSSTAPNPSSGPSMKKISMVMSGST
jgi:RNA polymerase sigma factor (sigma-70 family)